MLVKSKYPKKKANNNVELKTKKEIIPNSLTRLPSETSAKEAVKNFKG